MDLLECHDAASPAELIVLEELGPAPAGIEILVAHPAYAERAASVSGRAGSVRHVLSLGSSEAGPDLLHLCSQAAPRTVRAPDLDEETTAWLQYTGGTTGTPKGAMIPHRALVQLAQSVACSWGLPERPVYLAASPITHAAVLPVTATLARGGTVVLQQRVDPDAWLTAVETERVNFAFVVPSMIYAMLQHADPAVHDTSSIETLYYGAAPMTPQRLVEAQEAFGPVLHQSYGQSESIGMGTALRKDEHGPVRRPELLTSCGLPVARVRIEPQDDDGVPVPDGEVGEL